MYSAAGSVGGAAVFDPVDGGEDDEVDAAAAEIDPEQAARGAEVDDAAGDGDVAVVVGEDLVGDGEEVERGVGERAGRPSIGVAPEGLRGGEVLLEEGRKRGSWTRSFSRPSCRWLACTARATRRSSALWLVYASGRAGRGEALGRPGRVRSEQQRRIGACDVHVSAISR